MQRYIGKELIHFVGRSQVNDDKRYELLKKIIEEQLLKANLEYDNKTDNNEQKGIIRVTYNPNNPKYQDRIRSSCVCFCDIPVQDLKIHMRKYSCFGISFKKEFLVKRGVKPVFYFPIDAFRSEHHRLLVSPNTLDSYNIFDLISVGNKIAANFENDKTKYETDPENPNSVIKISQQFTFNDWFNELYLSLFYLLKPFKALENDESEENYYMEREWRSPIDIKFTLNDIHRIIIPEIYSNRLNNDFREYFGQITFS